MSKRPTPTASQKDAATLVKLLAQSPSAKELRDEIAQKNPSTRDGAIDSISSMSTRIRNALAARPAAQVVLRPDQALKANTNADLEIRIRGQKQARAENSHIPKAAAGKLISAAHLHATQEIQTTVDLGQLVKKAREKKGLTQQEFADLTGVGRRFVSELENGKPTGFAPLKALANTPEDRAWLLLWVRQLVHAENRPITVQEERMIDEGIAAVMRLPREQRSLDALRTMLGMADTGGVGARLEKWTSRGAMGWAFDNPDDEMTLDARFMGFDMTDFLDNAAIRAPLMFYLFHRIDKLLTGERTIIAVDEFWKALGDEAFRMFAKDGLKTYRKRNAMMVFATQSPADALKSDIASAILEQVATQVMLPNPKGAHRDYVEGLSLTEAEYQLIREELSPESHKFLVKQDHDSVVVELDLTGLDDELAVLSGRAETTPIAVQAAAEFGPDPAAWLPVFHQRRRPS